MGGGGRLRLKAGLEVHQQLDTQRKLFCDCPTRGSAGGRVIEFTRVLRPSKSELGQEDPAAEFEKERRRKFVYEAPTESSCAVEMDEEPPHRLNSEALEIGLQVALLLKSKPVDEVLVMRKIVIDGSNTGGFQRTALIGTGGSVPVGNREVRIATVCLEEDAAKLVDTRKDGGEVVYRLDRLGIPLIEVSTEPDLRNAEEAEMAALEIGKILRRTRRTKRGLGTIRQDVNISVEGGARVEIKGVQELSLIPKVIRFEKQRQEGLISLARNLVAAGAKVENCVPVDITHVFEQTDSRAIQSALKRREGVYALRVRGFVGVFGTEVAPGLRFGAEVADYARRLAGVGGIFHSDELPAYGIKQKEVDEVHKTVGCSQRDAFVIVVGRQEAAKRALAVVSRRCNDALTGVVPETRSPEADGTTRYSRPLPGSARMYPETDVPGTRITSGYLLDLTRNIPAPIEKTAETLKRLGASAELSSQIVGSEWLPVIEELLSMNPNYAVTAGAFLTQDLKELEREGAATDRLDQETLLATLKIASNSRLTRTQLKQAVQLMLESEVKAEKAIEMIAERTLSKSELDSIIEDVLARNLHIIQERKEEAFKPLMGEVMAAVKGRAPGSLVSEKLKERLQTAVARENQ